jgi:hypothetical protein
LSRYKTFDSTGLATAGRIYAGDLNAIQDLFADLYNLSQSLGVSSVALGEAGLQLLRYGAGEARLSGHMRVDGILRGLGGLFAGAYTTTARNAIAVGSRPFTLVIFNTTTNQFEYNAGSDATPNWQPVSPPIANGSITLALLAPDSVDSSKIVDGSIVAADISGTLKPSVSALAGTEALRALGTTAATAAAGNDARLSDTRTPTNGSVGDAQVSTLSPGKITGTAVITSDSRLSDQRVPPNGSVTQAKLTIKYDSGQIQVGSGATYPPDGNNYCGPIPFNTAFTAAPYVVLTPVLDNATVPVLIGIANDPGNGIGTTNAHFYVVSPGGARFYNWVAVGV